MTANVERSAPSSLKRLRLKRGTDIGAVCDLTYILQLAASLESLRASIRWFEDVSAADTGFRGRDTYIALITGAGWCGETIRLVKDGANVGTVRKSMLADDKELENLWDRITSTEPDVLVGKIHRIRDKCFAHWDREVFDKVTEWQSTKDEMDVFLESDADGEFLRTRYTWPWIAFMYDLAGDPNGDENELRVRSIFGDLGRLWTQSANLISKLLCALIKQRGLEFEKIEDS